MEPLTLALILAGGKAIQGIGQGIAAHQQAEGMMSDYEKKQLQKLQREQELGLLGFSDQEMTDVRQAIINPVKAASRERQDQLKATMAGMDSGSGSTFLTALAESENMAKIQAGAEDKIQKLNQAQRQREEQLLLGLSNRAAAQEAAKKAAITQAITLGIGGAVETGTQGMLLGEELSMGQAQLEAENEILQQLQTLNEYGIGTGTGGTQ